MTTDSKNLTDKQYRILAVVCDGNGKNENGEFVPCDIDELLDRLSYRTTKQSMQFSVRALEARKLIVREYEKRRGARRVLLIPTLKAKQLMGYAKPQSFIEDPLLSLL
ncbi:hypothetical protein [Methyloversatilis sp.]|uniref:hypothetical protein n=1 Tax=Methyloversatilis sp. TaxID=2569862 RepID=UPI0035B1979F